MKTERKVATSLPGKHKQTYQEVKIAGPQTSQRQAMTLKLNSPVSSEFRLNLNMTSTQKLRLIQIVGTNLMQKLYSNNVVAKTDEELLKIEVDFQNMPARMDSSAATIIPSNLRKAARVVVDIFLQ